MSDKAIKVQDISKAYLIGLKETKHETLAGTVFSWIRRPVQNYNWLKRLNTFKFNEDNEELFWALRNVSFDLDHGEAIALIGANGAGKSTLLRILSRISNPTYGKVEIEGRVSSLLDVGTGFNNNLTGRENVYLNGTILGMTKKEVDRKFDEIVAFSGVEKFIDTQVKKYSSGMRLRLAFSVAAHIESDIIIIDEVLMLGDAAFKRKSLEKITQVAKKGISVILTSHNLFPLQNICKRAILLKEGKLIKDGDTDEVITYYLSDVFKDKASQTWSFEDAPSTESVKLLKAEVHPLNTGLEIIRPKDAFEFEFLFYFLFEDTKNINIQFYFQDENEFLIFIGSTALINKVYQASKGYFKAKCRIPDNFMNSGKFTISRLLVMEGKKNVLYEHTDLLTFEICDSVKDKTRRIGKIDGLLKPKLEWEIKTEEEVEAVN